ncbi:hypothetical protein CEE37_14165 [candidate division LCP-89 bacterium B3_LCP]|uniref:Secretion system C-terminal sorting domain-containing protein n=1 Tax=candidate division LCP-89 bacterium B3_LCP TaxID=2012998 RepID=A0A532UQN6_UNCL8|nr:MAG: hypothetical protein CEE37_14165 [candidate division LCP-89 bacterium B3_LCP]
MCRKIFIAFLCGALTVVTVTAQTNIYGGEVGGTWDLAGSPYLIWGDITIPGELGEPNPLVIEPGVEVIFQGHYAITVSGILEAIGTQSDSIHFTVADTIERWRGIRFIDAYYPSYLSFCIIEYGRADEWATDPYGGGIYCYNSSPEITHCTVRRNSALFGGGIHCWYYSSPIIDNCNVSENSAEVFGGGIYCDLSDATVKNCTISGNSSLGYEKGGGGIFCYRSNMDISYCTISGNWTNDNGGGIFCRNNSSPTISHCTISGNSAEHGGGIYCIVFADPIISHCTISDNSAWHGGGIGCYNASPEIVNCVISRNSVNFSGGAIYCAVNAYSTSAVNCILWNNDSNQITGYPQVTYCDVQYGYEGTGNIDIDPMFVDAAGGDFNLLCGSPCIDAGNPDPVYHDPDSTRSDMGVSYYHHNFQTSPTYLDFGMVNMGNPAEISLSITNTSDSTLILYDFVPSNDCFYTDFDPADSLLLQGDSLVVTVTFSPSSITVHEDTLTIVNSSENWPLMLLGEGLEGGTIIESGAVTGTWEAASSPYWITGEITVPEGETLIIEPGVEVGFVGHFKLIVNGFLEAIGTETDSITFTAPDTSVGWHGIRFIDAPDSSHLAYCAIQNGNATGADQDQSGGGIYCYNSNPIIHHCTIRNNSADLDGGGIYCYNSNPNIENCVIDSCSAENGGGALCCNQSNPIIKTTSMSGNMADSTGGGTYCVNSDAIIENCTIIGNIVSAGDDNNGGGVCCVHSNPIIRNCTISRNSTWALGGGLRFEEFSNGIIENCTISENWVVFSGGGISCSNSSPDIRNCTIIDNSANNLGGGIISHDNSSPNISFCTISGNSAEFGGGMTFKNSSTNFSMQYCTIYGNTANNGGGIYFSSASPSIENCYIMENSAQYKGGGIYCWYSTPNVKNCTVSGNSAGDYGGGICLKNGASPIIQNCTISRNSATMWIDSEGGGIHCEEDSDPLILNCTVSMNSAGDCGSGINIEYCNPTILNTIVAANNGGAGGIYFENCPDVSVNYGDCYNNQNRNYGGQVPAGLGELVTVNAKGDSCDVYYNICLDPLFVYAAQNDYRLQWSSPCIDAGDLDPVYNDPDSTTADMGAFFYDQSMPLRILLTPFNVPIEIPSEGGHFSYNIQVTNIAILPLNAHTWCDVTLPNGSTSRPTLGPVNIEVGSEVTISRERMQIVPTGTPAGIYTYNAYSTAETDTSHDSFTFVKLGSNDSESLTGWSNSGESFVEIATMETTTPTSYSLGQNYPNPFNPQTTIRFGLPVASQVNLTIYNLAGRKVATVIDGFRMAGYHEVIFNASQLSSSLYFYRIHAGNFTDVKKMILVK